MGHIKKKKRKKGHKTTTTEKGLGGWPWSLQQWPWSPVGAVCGGGNIRGLCHAKDPFVGAGSLGQAGLGGKEGSQSGPLLEEDGGGGV